MKCFPPHFTRALSSDSDTVRTAGGKSLIYFGGCDYFRLSYHPKVLAAIQSSISSGLNVAASRRTTGDHPLYAMLEKEIARFFRSEEAVLLPNGYLTNLAFAQACSGIYSHLFLDENAHPSLKDAAPFFQATTISFAHCQPGDLEKKLRKLRARKKVIILTDGVFGSNGEIAPLPDYLSLLRNEDSLLIDEAHGVGVLGKQGRGTAEHWRIEKDPRLIRSMTFSKAFGVYGGAVVGAKSVAHRIWSGSRAFASTTPFPLPWVHGIQAALQTFQKDPDLKNRLARHVALVKETLRASGHKISEGPSPVFAVSPKKREMERLNRLLVRGGVFPCLIRYPQEAAPFFRFALSSEHSLEQLEKLLNLLISFHLKKAF